MNNADKPFPCTIGSCKQRFANADHLHVHCLKHEMSLKSLDTPVINDTTPTPTRFLKYENVSEDVLFTDLVTHTNPFDMEFRKASEIRRMSQDTSSSSKVLLDTPDTKQTDSDSGLDSETSLEPLTEQTVPCTELPAVITMAMVNPPAPLVPQTITLSEVVTNKVAHIMEVTLDAKQVNAVTNVPESPKYEPALPTDPPLSQLPQLQQLTHIQPQLVIQGDSKLTTQLVPVAKPHTDITAQTMAPLHSQSSIQSILNSLPSTVTTPLLIKLPDGQHIRVVPSIVANPSAPIPVAISANLNSNKMPPKATIEQLDASTGGKKAVKERLKEAVLSNQSHGNMNVMARAVEVRMREHQHEASKVIKQEITSVTVVAPISDIDMDDPEMIGGLKRRSSSDDDDSDTKRQKFLERNRAAAMRCREKKKQWVVNLESKAENLTVTNVKLNNEVLKLKNEVAQLKQLLLAHKDCPVTQMQQRQTQNWQVFHAINESEEEKNIQQTNTTTITMTTSIEDEDLDEGEDLLPAVIITQT